MAHTERITLTDNALSAVMKLSDGNPGATVALANLMKMARQIDPDSAFGPLGPLFFFDTHGIYGSDIHVFFKDVCKSSPLNAETVMRADQLGIQTYTGQTEFDFPALLAAVREQLPNFAKGM
jgi:hypothetical protein